MLDILINVVGWIGAICVLWAYFLISSGKATNKSAFFQWLNIVGAILLIINTVSLKAYPSAFVNVVWLGIAFVGLVKKD